MADQTLPQKSSRTPEVGDVMYSVDVTGLIEGKSTVKEVVELHGLAKSAIAVDGTASGTVSAAYNGQIVEMDGATGIIKILNGRTPNPA